MKFEINHPFRYSVEYIIRLFLPHIKLESATNLSDDGIATLVRFTPEGVFLSARLAVGNAVLFEEEFLPGAGPKYGIHRDECERLLSVCMFEVLSGHFGHRPGWGVITGVRPAKLFRRLCIEHGEQYAEERFAKKMLVNQKKIDVLCDVGAKEDLIVESGGNRAFSLYVDIPFCPTRCAYCSFVSNSVQQSKKLIPEYIPLLCRELERTAETASALGLNLRTIYIGGGTPTAIGPEQLKIVTDTIARCFDIKKAAEYTIEAGRPDTLNDEMLLTLKNSGCTRISINPQTLNNEVLRHIGRAHTAEQAIDAFARARSAGLDNINMDVIAGLPRDSVQSFEQTINQIIGLRPESVTVHTLAIKRSSEFDFSHRENGDNSAAAAHNNQSGGTAAQQLDAAHSLLKAAGYGPYYLYRQSKTVGNLENTGFSLPGRECEYNVFIMDETHTILGCGASAVTKLRQPNGQYIERIFNFKYPFEYISRFDEILQRKERIPEFYAEF